jgi:hypothetical protein
MVIPPCRGPVSAASPAISAAGCLSEDDAEVLLSLLEFSVLDFWGCVEALRGGTAQLTGLGEAVLADCEAFMTANFAIEPL